LIGTAVEWLSFTSPLRLLTHYSSSAGWQGFDASRWVQSVPQRDSVGSFVGSAGASLTRRYRVAVLTAPNTDFGLLRQVIGNEKTASVSAGRLIEAAD
jgi:hypothetical protein